MSSPGVSLDSAITMLNQRIDDARRAAGELASKTEPKPEAPPAKTSTEQGEGGVNVFA